LKIVGGYQRDFFFSIKLLKLQDIPKINVKRLPKKEEMNPNASQVNKKRVISDHSICIFLRRFKK